MTVIIQDGVVTIGDVVDLEVDADETLTGKTLTLELISPTGNLKTLSSPSISGATATFTSTTATFDEVGDWVATMYDGTVYRYYKRFSGHIIKVKAKPRDMAVSL